MIGPFDAFVSGLFSPGVSVRYISASTTQVIKDYQHYGPDAGDPNPHWFSFPHDGVVGAVLSPSGREASIRLRDGHTPGDSSTGADFSVEFSGAVIIDTSQSDDTDGDGIPDQVEDGAPHNGDGNQDGISDRQQNHVASFLDARDRRITLALRNRRSVLTRFVNVGPNVSSVPSRLQRSASFQAEIVNVLPDEPQTIDIIRPPGLLVPTAYLHYGTEMLDPAAHWFELPFDNRIGAQFGLQNVTLQLYDNEVGDESITTGNVRFAGAVGDLDPFPPQLVIETYLDANRNGSRELGERPLAGQPVYFDDNANGVPDQDEAVYVTDSHGLVRLSNLDNRSYRLSQLSPVGLQLTNPTYFHQPVATTDVGTARTVTPADVNGDGLVDLVVPNDRETVVLLNRGGAVYVESDRLSGLGADESAAAADFNSDGRVDLAVTYTLAHKVGIWFGNGDGTFEFDHFYDVGTQPFLIEVSDLTGGWHRGLGDGQRRIGRRLGLGRPT